MINMPFVSFSDRLAHAQVIANQFAPFVVDGFWASVKRSAALDAVLFASCNGTEDEREQADKTLFNAFMDFAESRLPSDIAEEISQSVRQYVTYCEVAQAAHEEPEDEAAIWEMWDRIDSQAEQDAQYEAWRNEY